MPLQRMAGIYLAGDGCTRNGFEEEASIGFPLWKRISDLLWLALTLPLWLPLMVLTALIVKLLSPGPVFYWQRRIGLGGREFRILKFRSMKVNAETRGHQNYVKDLIQGDRPMTKLDSGDPRLIPGGRILRALALDELPQIINVLRGDMSLVGPRPCTPEEFASYEGSHRDRVQAPPGMTGSWQVSGKNRLTFSQMIELDLNYCETMSPWLDCTIILRTGPAILGIFKDSQTARKQQKQSASGA